MRGVVQLCRQQPSPPKVTLQLGQVVDQLPPLFRYPCQTLEPTLGCGGAAVKCSSPSIGHPSLYPSQSQSQFQSHLTVHETASPSPVSHLSPIHPTAICPALLNSSSSSCFSIDFLLPTYYSTAISKRRRIRNTPGQVGPAPTRRGCCKWNLRNAAGTQKTPTASFSTFSHDTTPAVRDDDNPVSAISSYKLGR